MSMEVIVFEKEFDHRIEKNLTNIVFWSLHSNKLLPWTTPSLDRQGTVRPGLSAKAISSIAQPLEEFFH